MHSLQQALESFVPECDRVERLGRQLARSFRRGHRLLTLGVGGDAALAQQLANELVGRPGSEDAPLPALCLASDAVALSVASDEAAAAEVFSRQVRAQGRPGDVLVSNFGVVFAPDHANVASELARVAAPGARLGFTSWKPNPKLGELYRKFTEGPIEGREAYEWGREDHVEDMLGEDFELDFEDGTLWLEAESGEEIWELFSQSAPPVISLVRELEGSGKAEAFHQGFVELYESYRVDGGGIRAPRRYLLVLGRRK